MEENGKKDSEREGDGDAQVGKDGPKDETKEIPTKKRDGDRGKRREHKTKSRTKDKEKEKEKGTSEKVYTEVWIKVTPRSPRNGESEPDGPKSERRPSPQPLCSPRHRAGTDLPAQQLHPKSPSASSVDGDKKRHSTNSVNFEDFLKIASRSEPVHGTLDKERAASPRDDEPSGGRRHRFPRLLPQVGGSKHEPAEHTDSGEDSRTRDGTGGVLDRGGLVRRTSLLFTRSDVRAMVNEDYNDNLTPPSGVPHRKQKSRRKSVLATMISPVSYRQGEEMSKEDEGPVSFNTMLKMDQKLLKNRTFMAREILQTEEKYVKDLTGLLDEFAEPIRKSKLMSSRDYNTVFGLYPSIRKVHSKLLVKLESRLATWSANSCIADVVFEWLPNLSLYEGYASAHKKSKEILEEYYKQEDFAKLVKGLQYSDYKGKRGLNSFTSGGLPVQRLTRYVLMLRSIEKYTPPEHQDIPYVAKAIKSAENRIDQINNLMKA